MKTALRTKDIVQRAKIGREALRFYESKGLLPVAKRSDSGYREYSDSILARIAFIQQAQTTGFTLAEIKEFLKLGTAQKLSREFVVKTIDAKLATVYEKIKQLQNIVNTLEALRARAQDQRHTEITCPLLGPIAFKNEAAKITQKSKRKKAL